MRPPTTVVVRLAIAGGLVALSVWPSPQSDAADDSVEVDSIAEAWYAKADVVDGTPELPPVEVPDPCTLPIGCPPVPLPAPVPETPQPLAAVYPAGTLQVEATGGKRTARAYLVPDLTQLPADATILDGRLLLPVNKTTESGNRSVETARFVACLTTELVTDGDTGKPSGAPDFDCDKATSKARYDEKDKLFEVDLNPFIARWQAGAPNYGVALVPAADLGPDATWHVTLNGSKVEKGKGASSVLRIQLAEPAQELPEEPTEEPTTAAPPKLPNLGGGVVTPEPPVAAAAPPATVAPAPTAPALEAAPYALLNSPWYTYRGVIFLPLALLVAMSLTGRSLTRPLGRLAGR